MTLKAFEVTFDTGGSSGCLEVVLIQDGVSIEEALEAKTLRRFRADDKMFSKIVHTLELPLSKVKMDRLSITEFLLLRDL